MSRIEVDDLVATFNGQHIGQEQMDLAALQTQLAQSLKHFDTPSAPYPSPIQTQSLGFQYPSNVVGYSTTNSSTYGPNNTPTSTPSQLWGPPPHSGASVNQSRSVSRHRSNSVPAAGGSGVINPGATSGRMAIPVDIQTDWDEMDEVEEELARSSTNETEDFDPRPPGTFSSYYPHNNPHDSPPLSHPRPPRRRGSTHSNASAPPYSYATPYHPQQSSPSCFASSDPFYTATVHAQRSAPSAANAYIAPPVGFGAQFAAQSQARGGRWATRPGGTS